MGRVHFKRWSWAAIGRRVVDLLLFQEVIGEGVSLDLVPNAMTMRFVIAEQAAIRASVVRGQGCFLDPFRTVNRGIPVEVERFFYLSVRLGGADAPTGVRVRVVARDLQYFVQAYFLQFVVRG